MIKKQKLIIPIFAVLLVGIFAMAFSIGANSVDINPTNNLAIGYNSMVCTEVTRADGSLEDLGCSTNQIFDTGKEEIEDYLGEGTGAGDAFDWIELCDSVAAGCGTPVAGKSETFTAHAADGLSAVAGTVGSNAPSGNWSIWNTFTSTAHNQLTNVSRLQNANGDDLAGNAFGLVNLSNGDALLVNWTIWVT